MKRRDLVRYLEQQGCVLLREGRNHTVYLNPRTGQRTSVPRHKEIATLTGYTACDQVGIPRPPIK